MPYPKIIRNRYHRVGDINNRQHSPYHHEEDMQNFYLPLLHLHHRHLHTWGVCAGLEVNGSPGNDVVTVQSGIAIDVEGRMIVLADDENVPVQLTLSPLTGFFYVTLTYNEDEQPELGDTNGRLRPTNVQQAPVVRLEAVDGFLDNGSALILAVVEVDVAHQVVTLGERLGSVVKRRLVGQAVHTLAFQRPVTTANQVTMAPAANLSALPTGGLQLTVANPGDPMELSGADGHHFAELRIRAHSSQMQGALTVQHTLDVGGDLQVIGSTRILGPLTVDTITTDDFRLASASGTQPLLHVLAANQLQDSRIHLLPIGGAVGIGTTTPTGTLTVQGTDVTVFNLLTSNGTHELLLKLNANGAQISTTGEQPLALATTGRAHLTVRPDGNVGIGTGEPHYKLDVNGSLNATELYLNGASLSSILPAPTQWLTLATGIAYNGQRVGIGTTDPNRTLTIEATQAAYLNARTAGGVLEVLLGVDDSGGIVSTMTNHDLQLRAGGNETKVIIKANGNIGIGVSTPGAKLDVGGDVRVNGALAIPKTGDGFAEFSNDTYANEAQFEANNLKLRLGHLQIGRLPTGPGPRGAVDQSLGTARPGPIIDLPQLRYQFILGHSVSHRITRETNFVPRFSIDQDGNLYCAGNKAGYVIDYFVNRVGEALEQGDVVVISPQGSRHFTGTKNNIPLLEVDLTDQAYDSRLCGIVAQVVTTAGLPFVELEDEYGLPDDQMQPGQFVDQTHPLQGLAPIFSPELDMTRVQADQIGQMVTLGAFSHCKVDADIAPIAIGDLLTTSPTKGHAQKVVDITQATGAILGKALGALSAGQGKIPVLVTLH